jgi:hypothetical protein
MYKGQVWLCTPVIPATQEVELGLQSDAGLGKS